MDSQSAIKVGNVVRLVSGGPNLTVMHVTEPTANFFMVECVWFTQENHLQQMSLPGVVLKVVDLNAEEA